VDGLRLPSNQRDAAFAERRRSVTAASANRQRHHCEAGSSLLNRWKERDSTMQWIDRDSLKDSVLAGTFLNLGSPQSVEIAAATGFDWLLIDMEHGSAGTSDLRALLLAAKGTDAAPVVRIPTTDIGLVKFVLDSGAAGIMFPFVNSTEDARRCVEFSKYPPQGERGTAGIIRATDYGVNWKEYFHTANEQSLVVVQIETREAVDCVEEIAAIEGIDVLFVGPLDLSVSLGTPGAFQTEPMIEAKQRVVAACEAHGKTAGILSRPELVAVHREMGFRFLALGSDAGAVVAGMASALSAIRS